ncbi:MAG: 2-oxo acid dehydrogenase subunit E2 [Alphaproteobacteria bacterium]|nr:2-oxo acid dehydrogenase subunit E2 [Alphaproteobacteria bacterium]
MATEVILPKVDMDMATGKVSRWLVTEGATVKQGDPLFEIETDKAAMEIEAPASGVLGNVIAREGVEVPVGQAVAWIFAEGEKPGAVAATAPAGPSAAVGQKAADAPVTSAPTATHSKSAPGSVRATPLARRMARQAGLDIAAIAGSGPHGRIVKADVEDALSARAALPAAAAYAAAEAPVSDSGVRKLFAEGSFREIPHDKMRLVIARRLVEAKSTVPHFYLSADCRIDALLKLRAELNASAPAVRSGDEPKPAYKLSINDLIIKAWALALRDVPMANVTWTDGTMLCHDTIDVGVAVSIAGGLITPIIRKAEAKTLSVISNEMKDLAARAKTRKLKNEEYQGGTTAISNLGMFGVKDFAAIINPPHATILAVGSGEQRGAWENGVFVPATLMTVTLSVDHRAVDGALGAEALQAFRGYVEKPIAMFA